MTSPRKVTGLPHETGRSAVSGNDLSFIELAQSARSQRVKKAEHFCKLILNWFPARFPRKFTGFVYGNFCL